MRGFTKMLSFLLAAVICLGAFAMPALADVTAVRDLGDGSVEVRWDDADAYELRYVPKTGDDYQADLDTYGYLYEDIDGKSKVVMYHFAPGQSYWVTTNSSSTPYAYKAARAGNFTEWRTAPKVTSFVLREKSMEGKFQAVDYFYSNDIEKSGNMTSYGIKWQMTYPQLKNPRSFLWQIVITTPDDIRYVYIADGGLTLPAGRSWIEDDYREMDTFFNAMLDTRGEIPIGTYTFSIYWDGLHACSATFKVR